MPALLATTVQPPILTLLSTSSQPTLSPLFISQTDPSDPLRAHVTSLPDHLSRPAPAKRKWDAKPDEREFIPVHSATRGDLGEMVMHIQGAKMGMTYIQAGASSRGARVRKGGQGGVDVPLGVELPWVHFQLKRLGARALAVEVGVVNIRGVEGIIRCSSFQETPVIHTHRSPPLLHLPLALPAQTSSTLTQWLDLSLNISSIIPLFRTLPRPDLPPGITKPKKPETELPNGQFGSVSYVRVYANCRVRRIWLSEAGEKTMRNIDAGEFALAAARPP